MTSPQAPPQFDFDSPADAIQALLAQLVPVSEERLALEQAFGRVLSRPVYADRDSPPHDVSAMDGYAVRADEVAAGASLAVVDEIAIGQPPPTMPAKECLKISTGACVPAGCDGIIPREQVEEMPDAITLRPGVKLAPGQHIRQRGENVRRGDAVVPSGVEIDAPVAGALAAFGRAEVSVFRRVRVTILTTGNELHDVASSPADWQIRDSNTSTLCAGLNGRPWIELVSTARLGDDPASITRAIRQAAGTSDLIVTTGGVSMGDHDYLKPALLNAGGRVVYHKLPIRPGKPGLGGIVPDPANTDRAIAVVALPGNPVAVAVGIPLFVGPAARKLAGLAATLPARPRARLANPPARAVHLWRYLPARLSEDGEAERLSTKGSGDLAGASGARVYVELPPDREGPGPWVIYDVGL